MPTQHSLREATKRLAIRSNHVVDIGSTVIQHWEANATYDRYSLQEEGKRLSGHRRIATSRATANEVRSSSELSPSQQL